MTMATAYATFASGGIRCNPVVVTSIKDRNGKKLKVPDGKCKRTVSEKVANAATLGMSKVFTSGTAVSVGSLSSGQPASGKTGTTNSSQDTWFAGYTPQMATAVWVGPETVNGERDNMQGVTINGTYYGAVYGATFAGKIWKDITSKSLEGEPVKQFGEVDSSLVGSPRPRPRRTTRTTTTPTGATTPTTTRATVRTTAATTPRTTAETVAATRAARRTRTADALTQVNDLS